MMRLRRASVITALLVMRRVPRPPSRLQHEPAGLSHSESKFACLIEYQCKVCRYPVVASAFGAEIQTAVI